MDTHAAQRLELIDMHLFFYGRINRGILVEHFNIGTATASRTLREYIERWPENAQLIAGKSGGYFYKDSFEPAFNHDTNKALHLLCTGGVVQQLCVQNYGPPVPAFTKLLDAALVAPIMRAMVARGAVKIAYVSGTSGQDTRVVHPRNIFYGGGAWYYRAYDEIHGEYRSFRFSRTLTVTASKGNHIPGGDCEWNERAILSLAPHNRHPNPEIHAMDLGMTDKLVTNILTNAVVAGFVLTDLRVDCSVHGSLDPYEYPLRLMNRDELEAVESMAIAPGYRLR